MQAETLINQEAQDHAVACALVARLLGQLTPSCMRLQVLNKNLDKPTQGMALDNIKRPPTQVGGDQRAIGWLTDKTYQARSMSYVYIGPMEGRRVHPDACHRASMVPQALSSLRRNHG